MGCRPEGLKCRLGERKRSSCVMGAERSFRDSKWSVKGGVSCSLGG